MPGPVAITGATGFIGKALTRSLASSGISVRALTRRPAKDRQSVEWVHGDLDDHAALARLVSGAESIVHCAGAVRGRSAADFDRVNVTGTANLAAAALRLNPAPRFLFLSSLAAREPSLSWYASSKRRAEQALARMAGDKLSWAAFRPAAVYGPGDREILPLLQWMSRGLLPMIARSGHRFSLIYIDDLVNAIRSWLGAPTSLSGIFTLDDGTPGGYNWLDVRNAAQASFQRPVRTVSIPQPILYFVAHVNLLLSHVTRRSPMLTPGKLRELTHPDWVSDNKDIGRVLDWRPGTTLGDALKHFAPSGFPE